LLLFDQIPLLLNISANGVTFTRLFIVIFLFFFLFPVFVAVVGGGGLGARCGWRSLNVVLALEVEHPGMREHLY